ncbi:ABC transporter permease [Sedimentibacter sp. MB31-C6]|uniref:ABC transporter permease n=1 Tax=Sedimentibacter sp. MB31-C6 TaxID=3109366 RepID=UPI002DDCD6C7|nr:ABC transporter permease [Sedimentibacter sp. MB36-C1]WSI03263.1 ABC transporter permease [Sedimentibacter sp. MB36-C1]
MKKRHNLLEIKGLTSFFASLMAIIAGLLFGLIILFISNSEQAMPAFLTILVGGIVDGTKGIAQELYYATPIILTGLSVGFAFKTGLFNIGASGQFTCGAFAAIFIGIKWTFLPPGIHWLIALIGAMIAGAIWGAGPGLLKAFFNVNEVITSIMMNYIGMYLVNMAIVKTVYDSLKNQTKPVAASAIIPKAGLDKLFNASSLNIGIIIAILMVIIVYIILNKTTFGYELKACGQNKDASKYAGINEKKSIILSMVIAGGLSGLGGGLLYLSGSGKYLQVLDILAPEGFNGIPVALLGMSHPIGILFAGLFIAHITVGGFNIQLYSFVPEVIDMIIAAIIYCGAFALLFKNLINKIIKVKFSENMQDNKTNDSSNGVSTEKSEEIIKEES